MALINDEGKAKRLARVIISEFRNYENEIVTSGIIKGNIMESIKELYDEGLENFNSRVSPEIMNSNIYREALDWHVERWERDVKETGRVRSSQ